VRNNWKRCEDLEKEQDTLHAEKAEAHTAVNAVAKVTIPDLSEGLTYPCCRGYQHQLQQQERSQQHIVCKRGCSKLPLAS
jgi:hypothetical protein